MISGKNFKTLLNSEQSEQIIDIENMSLKKTKEIRTYAKNPE